MWKLFGRGAGRKPDSNPGRDLAAAVAHLERPALQLVTSNVPTQSHLGGTPVLPSGTEWPRRHDTRLRFLARISLTELQAAQATPWLPGAGALLFFYDDAEQPWGFDPANRGGWAVLHVPDDSSAAAAPTNSAESSSSLPFTPVCFRPIAVLPSPERPEVEAMKFSDEEFDEYIERSADRFGGLPKHQMLGLPAPIQGDGMELECQLASHGVYCGTPEGYASKEAKQLEPGAQNWRLLLQLDSDDALGVMWGDAGTLYFWVEQSAASRGDFSNAWVVLQCY